MANSYYYKVAVKAPLFQAFTYGSKHPLSTGQRVKIPLGSKKSEGLILGLDEKGEEVKNLKYILEEDFKLSPYRFKWLKWMSSYYHYPLGLIAPLSFPPLKEIKKKEKNPLPKLKKKLLFKPTSEQDQIVKEVLKYEGFKVHLLHGVTGSGKTEVYRALTKSILDKDKQVLILVPEIFLIPQIAHKFSEMFEGDVGLLHSKLTPRQKTNEWWSLVRNQKRILVGTRSSLLCPLPDLDLIVVDEEHEESFKQEDKFRYNARDAAIMLAKISNIPILLGSATPHLNSWYQALKGDYVLHQLKRRALNQPLPSVSVVDLKKEKEKEIPYWLSEELYSKIKDTLETKKQVALFLNRRGQASALICSSCGFVKYCSNCDIALTLHKNAHLLCHYCDYSEPRPNQCQECRSEEWIEKGLGTERVEEVIKKLFPSAQVLRADRDAIDSRAEMENFIRLVEEEKVDIIIGTQMLSKGLDFDSLKLVGLLLADMGFHFPDFRAGERTFQTLLQMSGRAGRKAGGDVVLQTFNPDHPLFQFAKNHDYEGFSYLELKTREKLLYPPFSKLILLHVMSLKEEKARRQAVQLGEKLRSYSSGRFRILGPSPAPLFKIRNQYRFQILIKAKSYSDLQDVLDFCLSRVKIESQTQMKVDRDPLNML